MVCRPERRYCNAAANVPNDSVTKRGSSSREEPISIKVGWQAATAKAITAIRRDHSWAARTPIRATTSTPSAAFSSRPTVQCDRGRHTPHRDQGVERGSESGRAYRGQVEGMSKSMTVGQGPRYQVELCAIGLGYEGGRVANTRTTRRTNASTNSATTAAQPAVVDGTTEDCSADSRRRAQLLTAVRAP
ncbi:MAG TPA: hypothetical protein VF942_06785 [Acidimicrobiales bacterium]